MTRAEFDAIQVVADPTAALALPETTKGGDRTKFLFADSVDKWGNPINENSQQGKGVGDPNANRVHYFERLPQERCCGTFGTVQNPASASFGLDRVYPGPYPGYGYMGYAPIHTVLTG